MRLTNKQEIIDFCRKMDYFNSNDLFFIVEHALKEIEKRR